jgi:hypothetical protein
MTTRKINFAGVPEPKKWTPAPSGEYVLELVEATDGITKSGPNAGAENTALKFEIVDCEGDLEEYNGRTLYAYATYGEGGLPVVKSMLRAFGAEVSDEEGAEDLEWDWDELLGQKLRAKIRSVGARRDKDDPSKEYGPRNVIQKYLYDGMEDDD